MSEYDMVIVEDNPAAYYRLDSPDYLDEEAFFGYTPPRGAWAGGRTRTMLPNGDYGVVVNGYDGGFTIPSVPLFSIPTTSELTFEIWLRPDTPEFPRHKNNFVHFAAKGSKSGVAGDQEYAGRMYCRRTPLDNPPRTNRISGYAFNPEGGTGIGSYYQAPGVVGRWIHYVAVFTMTHFRLYIDGEFRDIDALQRPDLEIHPVAGDAPVRLGCTGSTSFLGGMGKATWYPRVLPDERIYAHHAMMWAGAAAL